MPATANSRLPAVNFTGYKPVYSGADTACPGCGRTHWIIGRMTAECAFCSTALPLPEAAQGRTAQIIFTNRFNAGANRGAFTINGKAA